MEGIFIPVFVILGGDGLASVALGTVIFSIVALVVPSKAI